MDEKKGFHVTIADNSTDKIMTEFNTTCILGIFGNEEGTRTTNITQCDPFTFAFAVAAFDKMRKQISKEHPEIDELAKLLSESQKKKEETQQPDENINETKGE